MTAMRGPPISVPLNAALRLFAEPILEQGASAYESAPLASGEIRIERHELRSLLLTAAYVGTLNHALKRGFGYEDAMTTLEKSLREIGGVSSSEWKLTAKLIERFHAYQAIRDDQSIRDLVSEALWPVFHKAPYTYPSAMSHAVGVGLSIDEKLQEHAMRASGYDLENFLYSSDTDSRTIVDFLRSNDSLSKEQLQSLLIAAFERISGLERDREDLANAFKWLHDQIAEPPDSPAS